MEDKNGKNLEETSGGYWPPSYAEAVHTTYPGVAEAVHTTYPGVAEAVHATYPGVATAPPNPLLQQPLLQHVTPAGAHNISISMQNPSGRLPVGKKQVEVICPTCGHEVKTSTNTTHKCCCTHLCCFLMFWTGICMICSCLPYFVCDPETVTHFCPNCNCQIGRYYG